MWQTFSMARSEEVKHRPCGTVIPHSERSSACWVLRTAQSDSEFPLDREQMNLPVIEKIQRQTTTAGRENTLSAARNVTFQLLEYCRTRDWAGYDPYDALNSKLFNSLPFLRFA